ncbi:PTS fructose transporter subunit IIA [Collinsella sp. AGMB00827]|uniref:PTS fructose transporter subunit IIA n=1 Tax=Collinsella ureilytica TaxID=2869515 RepID=A0ABS7MJ11_9ACTN|nr:PTS fructose transporter subunit IIA [Collinsella urealyticum]MBY4797018.1 PTS fructose transporter subunit IIA [Collinsella urealyticum]
MIRLVVIGHGTFASGLVSAIELIFGSRSYIEVVEFQDGETKRELDTKVDLALKCSSEGERIIALCDVLQGSPFQSIAVQALSRKDMRVVFGVNLPMLIECVSMIEAGESDADVLIERMLLTGRDQIGEFEPRLSSSYQDDDWS